MKTKGFTLVEAMMVVAIIALIAAIVIPSYMGAQAKRQNRGEPTGRGWAGGWTGQAYSSPTEPTDKY